MIRHSMMLYASLEATKPASGATAFALDAAAAIGAHLDVLAPHVGLQVPGSWESPTPEQLELEDVARRQQLAGIAGTIAASAQARGISVSSRTEWAHAFGLIPFVGDEARLHDLVVTGVSQNTFLSERKVAQHVLFDSGRPVVIVPASHVASFACSRVTVCWDNTRTAARALHDALPFLRLAEQVVVTAVGGEKRFQTDPDGDTIEAALARKGLNARFELVSLDGRSIGQALQDQALSHGAELLVMGGFGHSRLRDFVLGGATREVLDNPRLPVLMSH